MKSLLFKLLPGICLCLLFLSARADEPQSGVSQIVVQRTACYGACPVDTLMLRADGSATYANFLPRGGHSRGLFSGTSGKARFAVLATFLLNQNFFELRPRIGTGNIDAPDFLVSATRDGSPYCVAFRVGDNRTLQNKMEKALLIAGQIQWTRDEAASSSGVNGFLRRPLTSEEVRDFRNDKSPSTDSPMQFALVELESLDHPEIHFETRSDHEGQFRFFAAPGRYSLTARNDNNLEEFRLDAPRYDSPSQTVEVKVKTFTNIALMFKNSTASRR